MINAGLELPTSRTKIY